MTNSMIATALDITLIGMGFVVGFLVVFLLITKLMSNTIQKIINNKQKIKAKKISEETQFVIKNAVEQHIKNV